VNNAAVFHLLLHLPGNPCPTFGSSKPSLLLKGKYGFISLHPFFRFPSPLPYPHLYSPLSGHPLALLPPVSSVRFSSFSFKFGFSSGNPLPSPGPTDLFLTGWFHPFRSPTAVKLPRPSFFPFTRPPLLLPSNTSSIPLLASSICPALSVLQLRTFFLLLTFFLAIVSSRFVAP